MLLGRHEGTREAGFRSDIGTLDFATAGGGIAPASNRARSLRLRIGSGLWCHPNLHRRLLPQQIQESLPHGTKALLLAVNNSQRAV